MTLNASITHILWELKLLHFKVLLGYIWQGASGAGSLVDWLLHAHEARVHLLPSELLLLPIVGKCDLLLLHLVALRGHLLLLLLTNLVRYRVSVGVLITHFKSN